MMPYGTKGISSFLYYFPLKALISFSFQMEKLGWFLLLALTFFWAAECAETPLEKKSAIFEPDARILPLRMEREGGKKYKPTTTELLRHMGMAKEKTLQANNHRKRVAAHSRKSHNEKHLQDSHIYVIKLPPNK